ncbi:MAG: pyrrolo-quinoline quinone [Myxococcales bacterium]|nr:pyrrolo-quinoline quinone [Myxococcales bacterium]
MAIRPIYPFFVVVFTLLAGDVLAGDWPMWGRTAARNMASPETGLVTTFEPGRLKEGTEDIDLTTTKNVKWIQKLGSQAYGNVTVSNGQLCLGTNNETPRQKKIQGDRGVVMCFEEETGSFRWQLTAPKLGGGKVNDWEFLGICSSPAQHDDRIYVVTNRAEVVCLDAKGMKNGNQGPFKDEGSYMAGPGKPAVEVDSLDADIIWRFDMRKELAIFPHNIASSSVLVVGDRVFVTTSNGVDWSHRNIPAPIAPSLVVLDRKTGALVGEEGSSISERVLHGNWASPALAKVNKKDVILFGAGDGYCYGFDPKPKKDADGFSILPELWRFDGNPKHYRVKDGKPIRYPRRDGPSEIIGTPVFHDGKVYVTIGQDPEHGPGVGSLSCIDPSKKGDTSTSGRIWSFDKIGRSISTVAIAGGLLFVADLDGKVYCLDAKTGTHHWTHDTEGRIWSSPLVADGKVYIGNADGIFTVLAASTTRKVLHTASFVGPIYSSAIAANGVVYVTTQTHLYALEGEKK